MARSALVTGCSSGIGRALARQLAAAGWSVYAGTRRPETLAELGPGVHPTPLDVCDEDQRREAVARIEREHGHLDALVNNAGYGLHGAVEEVDLADARQQLETNFLSVARLCQLVLPGMRARRSGTILNMSSMGGRLSFPGGAFYHASKHALEALSDALRFEVAGFGIRVVVVEPGPVKSGFGPTGIATLGSEGGDPAYATLRESIRAGLRSTFEGAAEQSSTPEAVAEVCARALEAGSPRPRYVVGDMAEALIERRLREDDTTWDRFLEGLYARPGNASASSGKTRSS